MKALNISLAVLVVAVFCVSAICCVDNAYADSSSDGEVLVLAIDQDWTNQHIGENITKFIFTPGATGVGVDYTQDARTPWKTTTASNYQIEFENGIISIGKNMFAQCKPPSNIDLVFPAGCTIGEYAFGGMQRGMTTTCHFHGNTIKANAFHTVGSNLTFSFDDGDNVVEARGIFISSKGVVIQKDAYVHFNSDAVGTSAITTPFTVYGNISADDGAFTTGLSRITSHNPAFYPTLGTDEFGGIAKDITGRVFYFDDENPANSYGQFTTSAGWHCYDDNGKLVLVFEGGNPNISPSRIWYDTDVIHDHISPNVIKIENDISYNTTRAMFEPIPGASADYWGSVESVELGPMLRCHLSKYSFSNMPNLKSVTFSALVVFDDVVFRESNALEEVHLIRASTGTYTLLSNDSDTPWKRSTYENLTIYIDDAVTNFGPHLFEGTTAKTVYIGSGLWEIHDYAFNNSQIEKIYWNMESDKHYQIGSYAFGYCANLKFIALPNNLSILSNAFANSGLEAVVITAPSSDIAIDAFAGCNVMKVLNLSGEELVAGTDAYGGLVANPDCEITTSMHSDAIVEKIYAENTVTVTAMVVLLNLLPALCILALLTLVGFKIWGKSRDKYYD